MTDGGGAIEGHSPQYFLVIVSQARRRDMAPLALTTAKPHRGMPLALAAPQLSSELGTLCRYSCCGVSVGELGLVNRIPR